LYGPGLANNVLHFPIYFPKTIAVIVGPHFFQRPSPRPASLPGIPHRTLLEGFAAVCRAPSETLFASLSNTGTVIACWMMAFWRWSCVGEVPDSVYFPTLCFLGRAGLFY